MPTYYVYSPGYWNKPQTNEPFLAPGDKVKLDDERYEEAGTKNVIKIKDGLRYRVPSHHLVTLEEYQNKSVGELVE